MDEEKEFRDFARFANQTRKPNMFKKVVSKSKTSAKGEIYVQLSLYGFHSIETANSFGNMVSSLLYEKAGYSTDYSKWSFRVGDDKTIKLVPTEYWKKYNAIPDYAGYFLQLPDDLGISINNNMQIEYSVELDEAISILINLELERIK